MSQSNRVEPTQNSIVSRRNFLRASAGAMGVAAVGVGSQQTSVTPVQDAEAIAPVVIAGAAAISATSVAAGWLLREYEIIGSDDPPEGMSLEGYVNACIDTAQSRESNIQSTFIDNLNILEGLENQLWADAKIAAIESINDQKSQSGVQDDAVDAANEHATVVLKNFLKTWNEAANEWVSMMNTLDSYEDFSIPAWAGQNSHTRDTGMWIDINDNYKSYIDEDAILDIEIKEHQYDLPNGEPFTVDEVYIFVDDDAGENRYSEFTPMYHHTDSDSRFEIHNDDSGHLEHISNSSKEFEDGIAHFYVPGAEQYPDFDGPDGPAYYYSSQEDWNEIYTQLTNTIQNVIDQIMLWVDEVYADVQEGELDVAELLTPRELAELQSEDEDFPQAIADLMALNVSAPLDREVELYIPDKSITLYGNLAVSGDTTLSTGWVDPQDDSFTYYFSYDASQSHGEWDHYEDGIDGGVITFTEEPIEQALYEITTNADETVIVPYDSFSEDNGEWIIDLSEDLEQEIAEIEEVTLTSLIEETDYQTVILNDQFEIRKFRDSDGEEYDEAEFDSAELHDDTNYMTEEDWLEYEERYLDLIEQYEESQESGGGIGGDNGFDFDFLDDLAMFGLPGEAVAAIIVVLAGGLLLNN